MAHNDSVTTHWGALMTEEFDAQQTREHQQAAQEQELQRFVAAQRPLTPLPVPPPLSPVAEATGTLGHCLALTEQLVLTLQARLAPVLRTVPVSPLGWHDLGLAGDCPLTEELLGSTAHLVALNTSLHSLVERLAL